MSNLNKFIQSFSDEIEKKQNEEMNKSKNLEKSIDSLMNDYRKDEDENSNSKTEEYKNNNLFNNKDDSKKLKSEDGTLKLKTKEEKQTKKLKLNVNKPLNNHPDNRKDNVEKDYSIKKLSKEEQIFLENRRKEEIIKKQLEEDLKRAKEEEISLKNKENFIKNETKNLDEDALAEKLFEESETPLIFKEKWLALYKKALSSGKQTMTNQKVRNGKFRINETGALEILPDFETRGKSSNELLHEVWKIN